MKEDMTYQEIEFVKYEINCLLNNIEQYAIENCYTLKTHDINFFRFISKQIIFFKYLMCQKPREHLMQVITSDFYYLMLALLAKQERYINLNERSIIEGYLRLIVKGKNHINREVFDTLKEINSVSQKAYSIIREEYRVSSGYIHGNKIMKHTLVEVFNEVIQQDKKTIKSNQYCKKIIALIKELNIVLVSENKELINGAFHRRKTIMSYLIGRDCVDLLFN